MLRGGGAGLLRWSGQVGWRARRCRLSPRTAGVAPGKRGRCGPKNSLVCQLGETRVDGNTVGGRKMRDSSTLLK